MHEPNLTQCCQWSLFTLYFEYYLRILGSEIENIPINMYDINQKWTEMRRSYFTREITYTDDYDFITEDPKVKKKHNRIVSNTENWKSTEK